MRLGRIFAVALLLMVSLVLTACGAASTSEKASSQPSAQPAQSSSAAAGKKALVVYFSRADENTGGVGVIEKGNTRILAEMIAAKTNADIFEIKPAKAYPKEYKPATEVAKKEKEDKARPEIVGELPDLSKYDTIFLGYPIWWSDLPMPVYTFLEKENFSGKKIAPFCTHEGSGIGSTESFIADATKAKMVKGLEMRGNVAQNEHDKAEKAVTDWLRQVGY